MGVIVVEYFWGSPEYFFGWNNNCMSRTRSFIHNMQLKYTLSWRWEERSRSPGRGWRGIPCWTTTTSQMTQHRAAIFGAGIEWARVCSCISSMVFESLTLILQAEAWRCRRCRVLINSEVHRRHEDACIRSTYRYTGRLPSHDWVYYHWVDIQVLLSCGAKVWQVLLKRANWRRDCKDHDPKYNERIPWKAWKHRLYALVIEELSIWLSRYIQRASWILQCGAWSCGRL
jgi:hypothetical protein